MAFYFLDTSALVKRYVQETGTAWIRNLTAPATGDFLFLARVTDVEFTAALARRRRQGSVSQVHALAALNQFRLDFVQDYRIVDITIPLLQRASRLADTYVLRAYDAVQLAAALEVRAQSLNIEMISADGDLNAAAIAEGMPVEDPNTH